MSPGRPTPRLRPPFGFVLFVPFVVIAEVAVLVERVGFGGGLPG